MKLLSVMALLATFVISHPAYSEPLDRPGHINEQFFEPLTETLSYYRHDRPVSEDCRASVEVWHKILIGMGIDSPAPQNRSYFGGCGQKTAIAILEQIRQQFGKDNPYQKIWAENQQRVFNNEGEAVEPPVKPVGENLPARTMSDYEYQLASWHFYKHEYDKALPLYQKVAGEEEAPMRPYAAYMIVRVLYYQNKATEAASQIRTILADDSLKAVHGIATNYRYILLWQGRDVDYDAELMQDFLTWLLQVIVISPEKAVNIEQSLNDFSDAKWHLNHYFPLYDRDSKTVDWWLRDDVEVKSPRMQAVKAMAPNNETVDWLQSEWALNIFDADWLWALHAANAPYWPQNQHIVNHAWQRWQTGDGLEWLEIVLSRVHPDDSIAPKALRAAEPYFERDWKTEGRDYRFWLADVWEHAIRLHLGRKEYKQARNLMANHQDYLNLRDYSQRYQETLENTLRWLVYTGEWDEARATLAIILKQYPSAFTYWRTLLATNWEEAMASAYTTHWSSASSIASSSYLWQRIANLLPAEKLYALAQDEQIEEKMRAVLANAALTRVMLLEQKDKVKDYAALAAKLNPDMRERILTGVQGFDHNDYIDLMLRVPRLRPTPFAMKWDSPGSYRQELASTAIDPYNHNDNNWWCRYDWDELNRKFHDQALVTLETNRRDYRTRWVFRGINDLIPNVAGSVQVSEASYIEKQQEKFAKHPFHKLVDQKELEALAAIPSGPQYLSEAVVKREQWKRWMIWRGKDAKNKSASDLHQAVRTTRYGCERNGSHGDYSHDAFKILHQSYGDSVWAKATPYWFE